MINGSERKLYFILVFIAAIAIFLLSARHVAQLVNIMAWDELGYWGNAAYLAGYDWSSVVSTYAGYYSYGYSLIIAVLFRVCINAHQAYQVAVLINALLNTGSFFLANYVGLNCFGCKNKYYVLLASIVVSIYSNNITQASYAWTECLLIFLYWCLSALFLSLNKKYRFYKTSLIIILTVYIYCVHNRTIGIVIASALSMGLYILLRKIPKKHVIFLVLIIALLIIAEIYFKGIIKAAVYTTKSDKQLANTVANAAPWMVNKLLSLYGVVDLLKTFLNRFLYFGIVTKGTFFVFCVYVVKKIYVGIIRKNIDFFALFSILSILGVFGVMSIHLSQQGSYQALLYGRYQDIVIGPVFLLGLLYTFLKIDEKKKVIRYAFLLPLILGILLMVARSIPIYSDYFVSNCNVSLFKFWIGTKNGGYEFNKMFLSVILGVTILAVICWINQNNKKIGLLLLLCFTIGYGKVQYEDSELAFASGFNNYYDMSEELKKIHEICGEVEEIYFYNDDSLTTRQQMAMWLQLEMFEKRIIVVEDFENLQEGSHLVLPRKKISDTEYEITIEPDGELLTADKYIALYRTY